MILVFTSQTDTLKLVSLVMAMLLFLYCDLWSIIGDAGFVVSSLVSSASAFFSFHLLTGKMGTRPCNIAVFTRTLLSILHSNREKISSSDAKFAWFNLTP